MDISDLLERLPFPIVMNVLDYSSLLKNRIHPLGWNFIRQHYKFRVCSDCGEFRHFYASSSSNVYNPQAVPSLSSLSSNEYRKTYCFCKKRRNKYEPFPHLKVSLQQSVNILRPQNGKNPSIYHSLSGVNERLIRNRSQNLFCNSFDVKDFYFIVDRQPQKLYNFKLLLNFLNTTGKANIYQTPLRSFLLMEEEDASLDSLLHHENHDDSDILQMLSKIILEPVLNSRSYPLFFYEYADSYVSQDSQDSQDLTSFWSKKIKKGGVENPWVFVEKNILFEPFTFLDKKVKDTSLPFSLPVSYLYPNLQNVKNLPNNAAEKFLKLFLTSTSTSTYFPYDPLSLLPPKNISNISNISNNHRKRKIGHIEQIRDPAFPTDDVPSLQNIRETQKKASLPFLNSCPGLSSPPHTSPPGTKSMVTFPPWSPFPSSTKTTPPSLTPLVSTPNNHTTSTSFYHPTGTHTSWPFQSYLDHSFQTSPLSQKTQSPVKYEAPSVDT